MIRREPGYWRQLWGAIFQPYLIKASKVGPMIARMVLGRPVWPERDYEKLAREGYQQNPVVYACIDLRAKAVADIAWVMFKGRGDKRTEVEEHEFLDMLDRPNPLQDRVAFIRALWTQYLISGNGYVERTDEKNFGRMELYAHRADRMRIVPGQFGIPEVYEYRVGGDKRDFQVDPDGEGVMPILHLKTVNPVNDWYGQSPLDACAWAIDIHNGESQQTRALQENSGSPSGALVFEGSEAAGTELGEDAKETLLSRVRGEEQGYDRKGSRMMLDGGKWAWLQFGLDPDKLKSLDTKNQAAREIAFTLKVPPMLLGIPGDNTYSNYQEARQAFYQETVIPDAWELVRQFNHWFKLSLGKNVYLEPNIDDLDALQPMRKEEWERVDKTQMLSLNEKREAIGYEPVKGGEEVMAAMTSVPLSMMSKEFMGGPGDPLEGLVEDDPEAKKPKGGAKHMPRASVHYPET